MRSYNTWRSFFVLSNTRRIGPRILQRNNKTAAVERELAPMSSLHKLIKGVRQKGDHARDHYIVVIVRKRLLFLVIGGFTLQGRVGYRIINVLSGRQLVLKRPVHGLSKDHKHFFIWQFQEGFYYSGFVVFFIFFHVRNHLKGVLYVYILEWNAYLVLNKRNLYIKRRVVLIRLAVFSVLSKRR